MKKVLSMLLLAAITLTLFGCAKNDDVPDGMQLARGGEAYGYYMYAPEEWTVSNHGDISAAYASAVDSSNISYIEIAPPSGTVDEYFKSGLDEFREAPTMVEENKAITFGNADSAVKYVFDHKYDGHSFRTMQVFTKYKDRFGIFTFTSPMENMTSPDLKQYEYYLDKINLVIENFKYTEKKGETSADEPEIDSDGYKLISDKSTARFSLYVPAEFTVKNSSGMVEAFLPDGSNISMSRATTTGIAIDEYWKMRKADLEAIFGTVTEVGEPKAVSLGESSRAFAYEYTFNYDGEAYHVYQVYGVTFLDGFVFTYTAKEENWSKHFDTVQKIIDKVTY